MVKITRRRALGLTGGALGLGACATPDAPSVVSVATENIVAGAYAGDVTFEHGVASGDPLPDSVVIWTRVTRVSGEGPIPVTWRIHDPANGYRLVASGAALASQARDYCVKVVVEDLRAGTDYRYSFSVDGSNGEVASPSGRTRTAPEAGSTRPVKFAVVSCSNHPFGFFNVYREVAEEEGLDAIIHLGDYLYEYGVDGYGGEVGEALDRRHDPVMEIVTLDDYRTRHAQYKSDENLQAAHAAAPWLCTWDDHESANDSYRTGAQNHNPEANEGDWSDRKQAAVQAYLDWMPVRDPAPGRAREAIYRKFDFGEVATVFCLETRLTGRSEEISWATEIGGVAPAEVPAKVMATMMRVQSDERTMLGAAQEDWLAEGLSTSVHAGKTWQVLANQTIMARVKPPNFTQTLRQEQIAGFENPLIQLLVDFSQLGLPLNLDAWDGFPAARARLYDAASTANARLVTLTGDTHTAWANTLMDLNGDQRGVEFGCTSVTSPGFGQYMPGVEGLGEMFAEANSEVEYHDPDGHGFTRVTLTPSGVRGEFVKVSTVTSTDYSTDTSARFSARVDGSGMTPLTGF